MYKEILPPETLRSFIECYWIRSSSSSNELKSDRVLPDGCIDFVFNFETNPIGSLVGTMTTPLEVETSNAIDYLGVRFLPAKARSFVRFQASEITDRIVPISDFTGSKGRILAEKLKENPQERIHTLNNELEKWIHDGNYYPGQVDFAVNRISQTQGSIRIERICESLGISRQYLSRIFRESIGISPKQFSRVVRFQALIRKMRRSTMIVWADEAAILGYYDQAHLISDFREFSGISPQKFLCDR
jgi:AraC-like DNA-binding protein